MPPEREQFFDDNSLSGYYIRATANVSENAVNLNLNADTGDNDMNDIVNWVVYLFKENTNGVREIDVDPAYPKDH